MKTLYPKALVAVVGLIIGIGLLVPPGANGGGSLNQRKAVFPNPFTERTTFELTMPHEGKIKIDVYNIRGQHMKNLFGGDGGELHPAGLYQIPWNGKDKFGNLVPSGVYICTLSADGIPVKSVKVIKLEF